jgi:uncharacterized protein (DUF952 family)
VEKELIYHFCARSDWDAAAGSYVAATERAAGRTDLVVLEIDEALLDPPAVWEDGDPPHPTGKQFPHVYGPIPVAAVVAVRDLKPEPDGTFAPL